MGWKKCPLCETNWIKDDEDFCQLCSPNSTKKRKLTKYIDLGGSSRLIYERFCHEYDWDRSQAQNFGYRKPLYARRADTERKRDIWFIFHSNLNDDSVAENGKHLNIIKEEEGKISEYYADANRDIYPLAERIVFVKIKDGGYKFIGVYRAENPYSKEQGRIFVKISDTYPNI